MKYSARRRIRANTVQYFTNIRRTPDVRITDGARPNMHASRTFHIQELSFRDERDMEVGRQWTDVDVRCFEPDPTNPTKDCQSTRVPRVVTHTRRINYARRLLNNASDFFLTVQNSKSRTNRL